MVITSLAAQLKQLETPQTSLLVHRTKKASFLFTEKEAANFDRDTIYELGRSGLEDLIKINQQFASFEGTLFDLAAKTFERSVQTAEVNEQLNKQIKEIVILLSPYFLLKPAHKVLEWLINRFHIHQYNIDEILFLGLPYHETMTFARLLQLIPLVEDKGKWNWLAPVKKSGVPLSKTALLNRAATDTAFLKFVCDMPLEAVKVCGSNSGILSTLFSFYCSTIVGGLESAREITDLHVSLVLPSIMSALTSDLLDYTSSAFIILARLSTKTKLSDKLVSSVYNKLSKVKCDKLKREIALILIVMSQSSLCEFPKPSILRLIHFTHLVPSICYWSSRGLITLPLVTKLLAGSLQAIVDNTNESSTLELLKMFIDQLLNISFDHAEAAAVFKILINEWKGVEEVWYREMFSKFQISFPQAFDAASSEALEQTSQAAVLRSLLGITSSRNNVFDGLVHPNPDMRIESLKQISSSYTPDQVGWLCETVLERLEDDVPAVVKAALACKPALISADRSVLSGILQRCSIRCWSNKIFEDNLLKCLINLLQYPPEDKALLDLIIFPIIATNISFINHSKLAAAESKLINFIKQKIKEGKNEKTAIWLSIEEDVLPKYSNMSEHLLELSEVHPVFKFLSIVLLAEEPAAFKSSILSEYLNSKMLVTSEVNDLVNGKTLMQCLNVCRQGYLPLQPALYFLVSSTVNLKCITAKEIRKTLCHDVSAPAYQSVLGVFSILIDGFSSERKKIRKIFKSAACKFLKENFPDKEERMHFLLSCAVWASNKGDTNLSCTCIVHLKHLLRNKKKSDSDNSPNMDTSESNSLLTLAISLKSPAVPILSSLLHSSCNRLRSQVLKIFLILIESFSPMTGYRAFAEQIISNFEELKLDPEQITVLCYTQLSQAKEIRSLLSLDMRTHMKNVLYAMLSLITDPETPIFIIESILEILECVNSSDLLIKLLPVCSRYINKNLKLDSNQSKVVKFILNKFDDTQTESFMKEDVWSTFDCILSDYTTSIQENKNENTNPSAYLINILPSLLFDNLPESKKDNQERFLTSIIAKTYECENVKVADAVSVFFKKVSIDGEIIASLLKWFSEATSPVKTTPSNKKIRKSLSIIPSLELLETPEWKKGVFLLEQIQSKNKFTDCTILIPALFDILNKCLLFEEQSPVEYTKQLILSALLQCCESIAATPISPEVIRVDLIVQCLRVSQNPQTHHHALLTLTIIANMLPDNVLHSIMEIFTFIGTSIARQDDAYSFQIISKLVETIIPILIKGKENEVVGVIRAFVDAMLDIPEHRRQVLLLKLLKTLDPSHHLWLFLALVFENHVLKHVSSQNKTVGNESGVRPKKLEIASHLCYEFEVQILLETSARLLELANAFPHDKDENSDASVSKELSAIFDFKANSGKHLRHFKYTLLGFLSFLLSSDPFIQQISLMSDEETSDLEDDLKRVMELCLRYVRDLSRYQNSEAFQLNQPTTRYWKVMTNLAYDVLDKIVGILPVDGFVNVVSSLLKDNQGCCPRKVIELVTWRLGQGRPVPAPALRPLLEPLAHISLSDDIDSLTRQTGLIALKLLIRHLAPTYTQDFILLLEELTNVLCKDNLPTWEVTGSLVLCLGELVASLGAHSISQLTRFMPVLLRILQENNSNGELFLQSCVTCLHKIVDTLSNFLSPYMAKIIYRLCFLLATFQSCENTDRSSLIVTKLKSIRNKLSSSIDSRVLVPAVTECYSKILKKNQHKSVSPLMALLADSFSSSAKSTSELTAFFLKGLSYRCETSEPSSVDLVEPHILSALTALVLKLSESAFRPLYHKIYDWAIRGSKDPLRAITFYRLSSSLAEKLRGLFVLFAGLFLPNSAICLEKYHSSRENEIATSEQDSIALVDFILKTLLSVFTYDSHNFLTKERFNLLMQPLVEQLENGLGGDEVMRERNEKLLTPCLANMSAATGDDSLWKQLNYQVLLKMRHSHPQVRLGALETVHQIAKKLREDFLPLLPETVPFLAELLEDSDETIEKQTHRAIASMEAVLGEPIQKYF